MDWEDRLDVWELELELAARVEGSDWVTLERAAAETGASRAALRSWYRTGQIPSRLVDGPHGPQRLVPLDTVAERAEASPRVRRTAGRRPGAAAAGRRGAAGDSPAPDRPVRAPAGRARAATATGIRLAREREVVPLLRGELGDRGPGVDARAEQEPPAAGQRDVRASAGPAVGGAQQGPQPPLPGGRGRDGPGAHGQPGRIRPGRRGEAGRAGRAGE